MDPSPAAPPPADLPRVEVRTLAKTAATMVIPLVVAVISLLFSMFTWWTTNRAPDVAVGVPSVVRVVQAGDSAWMYVQPHFIVAGATDRVAVVTGLSVTVAPRAGADAASFAWEEQGTWTYDSPTQALTWEFVADPSPLLVSASTPQSPVALMVSAEPMAWAPGAYGVTILATRADGDPVRAEFTMAISEQVAADLRRDPGRFLEVPATQTTQ